MVGRNPDFRSRLEREAKNRFRFLHALPVIFTAFTHTFYRHYLPDQDESRMDSELQVKQITKIFIYIENVRLGAGAS